MKKDIEFIVSEKDTLLPFLITSFSGKSRNYVKGILKRGQISVNGKVSTDFARKLSPGNKVTVRLGIAPVESILDFPIIHEDDELIVIDKPAGMLAIATDKVQENTAFHLVNEYVKSRDRKSRIFIVHRLDRETSGVMLFAKSERMKLALQEDWNATTIIRRGYIALVEGRVDAEEGTMRSWLKQTKTLLVYSTSDSREGKLAITKFKTLQVADEYSLLDITLETGRKNQIRVHMKDMSHPVAGDKKYGALTNPLDRLGLHASELSIKHPFSGEILKFESKTPAKFLKPLAL